MSADAGVPAVDLPKVGRSTRFRAAILRRLWQYLKVTGPLGLVLLVLSYADKFGSLGQSVHHVLWFDLPVPPAHSAWRLALSSNSIVIKHTIHAVRWELFYPLALARMLVGDVIWYYVGKDASVFKWAGWLAERLQGSRHRTILVCVFLLTFGEAWLPPLLGVLLVIFNIYAIAGLARVPLRQMVLADLAASMLFLLVFSWYAPAVYGSVP